MRRIIVAGSRTFNNYKLLEKTLLPIITPNDIILSGGADGADYLGEIFAGVQNLKLEKYPADWNDLSEPCFIKTNSRGNKYNALAGFKRNQKMVDVGDLLVCFHNGSSGSMDVIDRAKQKGIEIIEVRF